MLHRAVDRFDNAGLSLKKTLNSILFLDDVLSELDLGKREYLLNFIREHESQIFVTTTDFGQLGKFSLKDSEKFHVENGKISRGLG